MIVIDGPSPVRASLVATYLSLLNGNGVLFTVEPDMPTGDVAEDDVEGMAMVNGFNRWIELVGETHQPITSLYAALRARSSPGFLMPEWRGQ